MSLTPMQEQFMRDFLERQREIGRQAMETTKLLARTNIESILWAGLDSPPSLEKMEGVIAELKAEKAKQEAKDIKDSTNGENQP